MPTIEPNCLVTESSSALASSEVCIGMIDLAEAFTRLKATSFYYRQGLLDALLARQRDTKGEQL
jgi:hypothetical protein